MKVLILTLLVLTACSKSVEAKKVDASLPGGPSVKSTATPTPTPKPEVKKSAVPTKK